MSILINGMEMPTHCMDCPFMVSRDNDDCILQSAEANESFENWEQMKAGCPLVPVPEHGRLGDLDALVERIDGIWDCNDMVFRPNDKICNVPEDCKGCKWVQTKDCIQRMVENAPTIIPAEEGYQ